MMIRSLKLTLTLIVLQAIVSGCIVGRNNVEFFAPDIERNVQTRVESVHLCSQVKQIVLKNRQTITLNEPGVRFDTTGTRILGTDYRNEPVAVDISEVSAVVSVFGEVINFDETGGRIDLEERVVTGTRSDSTQVSIPQSDICHVKGKTLNLKVRPIPLIISVALICVLLFADDLGPDLSGTFDDSEFH